MTTSYKIALIAAVILCGVVLGYAFLSGRQTSPEPIDVVRGGDVPPAVVPPGDPGGDPGTVVTQAGDAPFEGQDRSGAAADGSSSEDPVRTFDLNGMVSRLIGLAGPESTPNAAGTSSVTAGTTTSGPQLSGLEPRVRTFGAPAPRLAALTEPRSGTAGARRVPRVAGAGRVAGTAIEASTRPPAAATGGWSMESRPSRPRPLGSYTIRAGDTFNSLAIRDYGAEKYWVEIAAANPHIDPRRLRPGQVIRMPDSAVLERRRSVRPPGNAVPQPPDGAKIHVVRSGESLWTIARFHYRDPEYWRLIYNANREAIGIDPGRLEVGMRLVVPKESGAGANE